MGRSLRTRLDLFKPNHEKQVVDQQAHQKSNHDKHCKHRQFSGDLILAKNFSSGPKWLAGVIVEVLGPLSYQIKLDDNRIIKRHVDHLLTRSEFKEPTLDDEVLPGPVLTQDNSPVVANDTATASSSPQDTVTSSQAERRYPQRQHLRKPERYQT